MAKSVSQRDQVRSALIPWWQRLNRLLIRLQDIAWHGTKRRSFLRHCFIMRELDVLVADLEPLTERHGSEFPLLHRLLSNLYGFYLRQIALRHAIHQSGQREVKDVAARLLYRGLNDVRYRVEMVTDGVWGQP